MHRNRLRNSIIILAAAMLGAVTLASSPASAHHMGGFRTGGFHGGGFHGFHHMAYRQHFFLRPASDLHPAPFCGNRRADLARRGLLARPPRLDLLGMELATGVGVRLRLSRFDAALPEAAYPDRGHCFERFADTNADRGLDDNPSRYPTHINIGGNTCRIERTGSRSPVRPR
jgi:hypothetical protein